MTFLLLCCRWLSIVTRAAVFFFLSSRVTHEQDGRVVSVARKVEIAHHLVVFETDGFPDRQIACSANNMLLVSLPDRAISFRRVSSRYQILAFGLRQSIENALLSKFMLHRGSPRLANRWHYARLVDCAQELRPIMLPRTVALELVIVGLETGRGSFQ